VSFAVVRRPESAAAFHARVPASPFQREGWVAEPTGPALVLGSTQTADVVAAGAVLEVVRRRSGGGAVLVAPGAQVWVDVLLPADDPLWDDDVGRSTLWLGDAWVEALAEVGVPSTRHEGAMVRNRWSSLVCFAGLGPGEVTGPAGQKLVGISQRRTRDGARFQCSAPLRPWDPGSLLDLLALPPAERAAAEADLADAAGHLAVDHETLLEAFLTQLA
jgi:hypothetical protein